MILPEFNWNELEQIAAKTVATCVVDLPDEIRELASKVPLVYRHWHRNAPNVDPEAMFMLGEYSSFGDEESGIDESGVITLFIGAIAWYCDDEGLDYEDEIRKTFLHELGHHLGWDEGEIMSRGL